MSSVKPMFYLVMSIAKSGVLWTRLMIISSKWSPQTHQSQGLQV